MYIYVYIINSYTTCYMYYVCHLCTHISIQCKNISTFSMILYYLFILYVHYICNLRILNIKTWRAIFTHICILFLNISTFV